MLFFDFPAEAAIPNSRLIHFISAIDKEPFTLQISIPILAPRPKAGYPVIYVLDGELYFPEAAIASDFLGDKAAVVVGIGHEALNDRAVISRYADSKPGKGKPLDGAVALNAFQRMRDYDFKWPVKPEQSRVQEGVLVGRREQGSQAGRLHLRLAVGLRDGETDPHARRFQRPEASRDRQSA